MTNREFRRKDRQKARNFVNCYDSSFVYAPRYFNTHAPISGEYAKVYFNIPAFYPISDYVDAETLNKLHKESIKRPSRKPRTVVTTPPEQSQSTHSAKRSKWSLRSIILLGSAAVICSIGTGVLLGLNQRKAS